MNKEVLDKYETARRSYIEKVSDDEGRVIHLADGGDFVRYRGDDTVEVKTAMTGFQCSGSPDEMILAMRTFLGD